MYKIYRIHKLPFKKVISLAIERKMYLKIQQNFAALVSKQAMHSAIKKTRLNSSMDDFLDEKLPFLHKKKTEHSFELPLSIFCFLTVSF